MNARTLLLPCLLSLTLTTTAAEGDFITLEKQFRELPMEARRYFGPLFWLHGDESKERIEMYVGKVAEGGNGSFTPESRPHSDWLGEGWFRDLSVCIEQAKKHTLKVWIFDEKWWPSQGVGGKVPPRYAAKQLEGAATEVQGGTVYQAEGFSGGNYVASIAGRLHADGGVDGSSLLDLSGFVQNGKLTWPAPPGKWQVMKFTHKQAPGLGQGGGKQLSVDGLSRDCVDWFIQTVYQPHYDRFKADFGKTIEGFFYDEPETRGDWGTELNAVLQEHNVDWKKAYVAYKFRLSGEEQTAAQYQYLEARAEAWGRTMYGATTRWCEERGVKSIGHFMEHKDMYTLQDFCAGDMMRVQKYSSMGGIDAVFTQFVWGKRVAKDAPCWQTPKLGSSISHAYGKQDDLAMVEIFGARGQDLTYPEMKWWADHMFVSGVNFHIPHSFNLRAPYDTDCPPYFYNGGFEPRWPLYRVFADYCARLSLMLSGGRHVAQVALLSPGQSLHVGRATTIEQISESLQDALYDCDWLPYEVLERDAAISGRHLKLRDESYQVLFVPPVEVIPYPALAKAKEFFDKGGVVVGSDILPTKSATLGKSSADIARLRDAIWGTTPGTSVSKTNAAGGRSYFLPAKPSPDQIRQTIGKDARTAPVVEVVEGQAGQWLHALHRVKNGRDVFFIANQDHVGEARRFRFRIVAQGEPEVWDPMRNELTSISCQRNGLTAELTLTMQPNESILLVFQPGRRPLPKHMEGELAKGAKVIPINRVPMAAPETNQPPTIVKAVAGAKSASKQKLTLSPAKADPFVGFCELPAGINAGRARAFLEMDELGPEVAARVTINDNYAGGLLALPLRLEITKHLRAGKNTVRIEPFAPKNARIVLP